MNYRKIAALILLAIAFSCAKESPRGNRYPLLQDIRDAETNWDTRFIDLGSPAADRWLGTGWSSAKRYPDGLSTVTSIQNQALVRFNVLTVSSRTVRIRCRTIGSSASPGFVLLVNGQKARRQKVDSSFRDYTFSIPPYMLQAGQNFLTIAGKGMEFDSIRIASTPAGEPAAIEGISAVKMNENRRSVERILVSIPSSIGIYLKVPKDSDLSVHFGLPKEASAGGNRARFTVSINEDGKPRRQLVSKTIRRGYLFGSLSRSLSVSLHEYSGRIVRLLFEARNDGKASPPAAAYWNVPEIIVPADSAPKASVERADTHVQKAGFDNAPQNVIIYVVDAMRADRLQSYGYSKATSPRMLEFGRDSVVFEKAYANVSWTRASVATILTGLYPSSHLTEDRLDVFPGFATSIQKELQKAGFFTIGVTTNGNISPDFKFEKHFNQYLYLREKRGSAEIHKQSKILVPTLNELVSNKKDSRFFLYVHASDPHEPHTVESRFLHTPASCNLKDTRITRPSFHPTKLTPEEMDCIRSLYDSEIEQADFYFGKFLDHLKKLKIYDRSLIILSADHGESLFEHRLWGHGHSLNEAEIHIPLIVHFPKSAHAGARVPSPVRHIDLFPTILDAVGLQIPQRLSGKTFLPLINQPDNDTPVFAELRLDQQEKKAIIWKGIKVIKTRKRDMTFYRYFDLAMDPSEMKNDFPLHPVVFGYLRTVLNNWSRMQDQAKAGLKKEQQAVVDPELQETLKALGYLQ